LETKFEQQYDYIIVCCYLCYFLSLQRKLRAAAGSGNLTEVESLLAKKVNINSMDEVSSEFVIQWMVYDAVIFFRFYSMNSITSVLCHMLLGKVI
jgi:hypothetical protein